MGDGQLFVAGQRPEVDDLRAGRCGHLQQVTGGHVHSDTGTGSKDRHRPSVGLGLSSLRSAGVPRWLSANRFSSSIGALRSWGSASGCSSASHAITASRMSHRRSQALAASGADARMRTTIVAGVVSVT